MPTAIITGASRGIGKAVAVALAKRNYQVVLVARDVTQLKKVADEISLITPEPIICPLDIKNEEEVKHRLEDVYKKTGSINILVNAAGILLQGTSDLPTEDLRNLLETNLLGAFYCAQAVVPVMKNQKEGYIFNLSSRAGKFGIGSLGGYCMSKFGLMGLNDSLFFELAEFGIKVTALCPGFVDTEMAHLAKLPKEDRMSPKDIVKTIEFLLDLSPQCRVREIILECTKAIESANISPFFKKQ